MWDRTDFLHPSGLAISTHIRIWPYTQDPVHMWAGHVILDASKLKSPVSYKFHCLTKRRFKKRFTCTNGNGLLQEGMFETIIIKFEEEAIESTVLHLLVDDERIRLHLEKIPQSDVYYWGVDTSDNKQESTTTKPIATWSKSDIPYCYELVSNLLQPIWDTIPNGLRTYIEGTPKSTIRQQLYKLIYPVTLEVLSELGKHSEEEKGRRLDYVPSDSQLKAIADSYDDALVETILIKLSEKLRPFEERKEEITTNKLIVED